MSRAGLSSAEWARRVRVATSVAAGGGNMRAFAAEAGLDYHTAWKWSRKHQPDLHRRLTEGPRGPYTPAHQALVRLLLIKSVEGLRGGQTRLARALGLTPGALTTFRQKWAPDGLDAAIADLMPDEGEAAHG